MAVTEDERTAAATAATNTSSSSASNLDDPANVRRWLQTYHPKQLALLDDFEISLRLGRFSSRGCDADAPSSPSSSRSEHQTYQYGRERRFTTTATVELLRAIIGPTKWKTAAQLLTLLRGLGNELQAAGGYREPAIGNMVRRIMYAVRDEADRSDTGFVSAHGNTDNNGSAADIDDVGELTEQVASKLRVTGSSHLSLSSMLWANPQLGRMKHSRQAPGGGDYGDRLRSDSCESEGADQGDPNAVKPLHYPPNYYHRRDDLRQSVMEAIQEMMGELEDLHKNINEQAVQHIHAGEIILTYALSKTVELFLKAAAAKKRTFQVIVCEGAPHFGGHAMAKSLAEAGIDTTVIHDAATFAIMARVNKVLLPAHAVLANGGLIAPSGSNMVALAAKHNSVPVVTVAGMFKLCPMYPHEGQDTLNDLISPSAVVDYSLMGDPVLSEVEFVNPVHDYIPPQLIDLYVTNIGGYQPSYIYRLLAEYYHSDDWEAFE